ncbi:MAG: PAS domain-containing protein [Chloroflexota bacterium]
MDSFSYDKILKDRLHHLRQVREDAETLLSEMNQELSRVNQNLEEAMQELEEKVLDRTAELEKTLLEIKQKRHEIALIREINSKVVAAKDLQACLNILADCLLQIEGIDQVGISLLDDATTTFIKTSEQIPHSNHPTHDHSQYPLAKFIDNKLVLDSKKRILITDIQYADDSVAINHLLQKEGIYSLAILPILISKTILGSIAVIVYEEGFKLNEEKLDFIESLIGQASSSIYNKLLFKENNLIVQEIESDKWKQELAQSALDNSPAVLVSWDLDSSWQISYVTNNVQKFGYDANELITKNESFRSMIHPDDYQQVNDRIKQAYSKNAKNLRLTYRIINSMDEVYWVEDHIHFFREAEGHFVRIESTLLELAKPHSLNELTQSSLEQTGEMLVWINKASDIIHTNLAATQTLGYARNDLIRLRIAEVIPDFDQNTFCAIWKGIKTKKNIRLQTQVRIRSGRQIPVELTMNLIEHDGQEYIFACARHIPNSHSNQQSVSLSEV